MTHRHRGFTLLEILLVLLLIAAAWALAAMIFTGGMKGVVLRDEAKQVAAQLRYTRAKAIATGRVQRFTIDPHHHTWAAPEQRAGRISESLIVSFYGAREASTEEGENGILFFPNGVSTGGRIHLQSGRTAMSIGVSWLTGEVRVERVQTEAVL